MRKRTTALEKARDRITTLENQQRNLMTSLATERNSTDILRREAGEAQAKIDSLEGSHSRFAEAVHADAQRQRQHIRRLFNSIFHANLEIARKAGYIDRVREQDAITAGDVVEPTEGGINVDRARAHLADAANDRTVNSILDGMDPDVLDQVLGRGDGVQTDFA